MSAETELEAAVWVIVSKDTGDPVPVEESERNVARYRAWLAEQTDANLISAYERALAKAEDKNRVRRWSASPEGNKHFRKFWADEAARMARAEELAATLPRPDR